MAIATQPTADQQQHGDNLAAALTAEGLTGSAVEVDADMGPVVAIPVHPKWRAQLTIPPTGALYAVCVESGATAATFLGFGIRRAETEDPAQARAIAQAVARLLAERGLTAGTVTEFDGITITHTRADGTLVDGTSRGDGTAEILKADRFRWSRNLGMWYLPHSRDRQADTFVIERAAANLRAAGHTVAVTTDSTTPGRATADAEADRSEAAEARADRYSDRAERAIATSDAMRAEVRDAYSRIPAGQPILIGHHSEKADRNRRERLHKKEGRAIREGERGRYWEGRADAAANATRYRENIPTTLRRIKKLEADRRKWERNLAQTTRPDLRAQYQANIDQLAAEIDHWTAHVEEAQANGVKVWSREDFRKGDFVRTRGRWYEVIRVNEKSLTVPSGLRGGSRVEISGEGVVTVVTQANSALTWTDRLNYDEVSGRIGAAEMAAYLNPEPTAEQPPTVEDAEPAAEQAEPVEAPAVVGEAEPAPVEETERSYDGGVDPVSVVMTLSVEMTRTRHYTPIIRVAVPVAVAALGDRAVADYLNRREVDTEFTLTDAHVPFGNRGVVETTRVTHVDPSGQTVPIVDITANGARIPLI